MTMKYELKKLIGSRIFVAFFIAMLCANMIMAFSYAQNPYSSKHSSIAQVSAFFSDYEKNPEKYDQMYNSYTERQEEFSKLLRSGEAVDFSAYESMELYPESGLNDGIFYNALYSKKNITLNIKKKSLKS